MSIIQFNLEDMENIKSKIQIQNFTFPKMRNKLSQPELYIEKNKLINPSFKNNSINSAGSSLRRSFSLLNYKKSSKILNRNAIQLVQKEDFNQDFNLSKKISVNHLAFPEIASSTCKQIQNELLTNRSHNMNNRPQMNNGHMLSQSLNKIISKGQTQDNKIYQTQRKIIFKKQHKNNGLQRMLLTNNIKIFKKPVNLQGCKLMLSRRSKFQQNPQELLARKLVWNGKSSKKVDYLQIHKEIIQKSQQQKNQKPQIINIKPDINHFLNCHSIGGWMSNDFQVEQRSRKKSQLYNQYY